MVKKESPRKQHIIIKRSLGLYAASIFVLFILLSLSVFTVVQLVTMRENADRLHRIQAIYQRIDLDDTYRGVHSDLFGDKRTYQWDKDRSASSSMEYAYNDTPSNTRADLAAHIAKAGFTRIGGAYEDSPEPQDHYKNNNGEYIRVTVSSKYVHDALTFGALTKNDPLVNHKNEAPTYVTIKVNLDDNNE